MALKYLTATPDHLVQYHSSYKVAVLYCMLSLNSQHHSACSPMNFSINTLKANVHLYMRDEKNTSLNIKDHRHGESEYDFTFVVLP